MADLEADTDTLITAERALADHGTMPLPLGPLAPIVAGAVQAMAKSDWLVAGPRTRVGVALRGCPPERLVDVRSGARPYKLLPVSMTPGTQALHAVGVAMATQTRTLCILGPASAADGSFHEALNTAVLNQAPVTFLVATPNNQDDAPFCTQLQGSPAALATAMGMPSTVVKGNAKAVHKAVSTNNKKDGPALVEANY